MSQKLDPKPSKMIIKQGVTYHWLPETGAYKCQELPAGWDLFQFWDIVCKARKPARHSQPISSKRRIFSSIFTLALCA